MFKFLQNMFAPRPAQIAAALPETLPKIKIIKPKPKEIKMAKVGKSEGQTKGPINQHKALAEGKKVTGEKLVMKKGGKVAAPKKKGK